MMWQRQVAPVNNTCLLLLALCRQATLRLSLTACRFSAIFDSSNHTTASYGIATSMVTTEMGLLTVLISTYGTPAILHKTEC